MPREALTVFVEHFEYPPTEQVVTSIRSVLRSNYADYASYVTSGRTITNPSDISHFVRYGMETTENLMKTVPRTAMAASVLPLILEVTQGSTSVRQGIIFVPARTAKGHELVYAHFVGKIVTPVEITCLLADAVNGVLEERGSLHAEPAAADIRSVAGFIDAIVTGATEVLNKGSVQHTLHS